MLEASTHAGRPLTTFVSEHHSISVSSDWLHHDRSPVALVLAPTRCLARWHVHLLVMMVAAASAASAARHGAGLTGHRVRVVVVTHVAVLVHLHSLFARVVAVCSS